MHSQNTPAVYSPFTGGRLSPVLTVSEIRNRYPCRKWEVNPWTGKRRLDADIASDPTGMLILPPGEELLAAMPEPLASMLENAPFGPIKLPKAYTPNPLNTQEGGDHYRKMKIQPIEYIHANGIPFAEGCAIKYLTRWRDKGGVEDLKKARHFIDLLIELETRK